MHKTVDLTSQDIFSTWLSSGITDDEKIEAMLTIRDSIKEDKKKTEADVNYLRFTKIIE